MVTIKRVKLAILLLCALSAKGQIQITASRMGADIPRYLVGAISTTITPYSARACNSGPTMELVSPDLVIQAIERKHFAVQPGEDVLDAVRAYRGGRARVIGYNFAIAGMKLVPALAFLAGPVENRRDHLRQFVDPKDWWKAGMPDVPLGPGMRCLTLKFGVLNAPGTPDMIEAVLGPTPSSVPPATGVLLPKCLTLSDCAGMIPTSLTISSAPTSTHPQVDEEAERVQRLLVMIRESRAARGVVE